MLEWFRVLFALPPGASTFSDGIDELHLFVIGTAFVGSAVLFVLTTLLVVRNRERTPGGTTPRVVARLSTELAIASGILALFLVWWVMGYRQYVRMRHPPAGARTIYVTAKQWMWKFTYPEGRTSTEALTVPVHRQIELVMTSRDVIHSLFVPAFRLKQDVVPGRYVTAWFEATKTGRYPIYCAEYCGISHSGMVAEVRVLSAADYAAWEKDETAPEPGDRASLASLGLDVITRHACPSCHSLDGRPGIGPSFARLYDSTVTLADGSRVRADPAYLSRAIMDPGADVVSGYRSVMPTYVGSLTSPDVAAIVEYLRSRRAGAPGGESGASVARPASPDGGPP